MSDTLKTGPNAAGAADLRALALKLDTAADNAEDFDDETSCLEAAKALRELADLRTPAAAPDVSELAPVTIDDADRLAVAGQLLGDIAQHIASARATLRELADTDPAHGVADLLAVAGFLADFGAALAGEPGHAGDPRDWFLKPTTRAAVDALGKGRA
jgi:hypothetical protein